MYAEMKTDKAVISLKITEGKLYSGLMFIFISMSSDRENVAISHWI